MGNKVQLFVTLVLYVTESEFYLCTLCTISTLFFIIGLVPVKHGIYFGGLCTADIAFSH